MKALATVGEALFWSYANLAMAHAALEAGVKDYGRLHYSIRSGLFAGLCNGSMRIGTLLDDERTKMFFPQACSYCGDRQSLSIDHLVPRRLGGPDIGDNLVWACRRCNSRKGAKDALEWLAGQGRFPPLLLLRRYLKLAVRLGEEFDAMGWPRESAVNLPFTITGLPGKFPPPTELVLWTPEAEYRS